MPAPLSILHRPYGLDAAYQILPDERQPRDPVGGDMVSVGFVTRPGRAAEQVRVCWERNGRPQAPIGARPVTVGTDEDQWLVELGVVEAGDTVEYWIEATGGDATARSDRERFAARRWRQAAELRTMDATPNGLRLQVIDATGAAGPWLTLARGAVDGTVRLELAYGAGNTPASGDSPAGTLALDARHTLVVDGPAGTLQLRDGARPLTTLALRWLEGAEAQITTVEIVGSLTPREALVGFGERYDALDQRGRAPDAVVYEQYKNQGNRTYFPVPFFMSSAGYGCLVDGTALVRYDLGRTMVDRWRCVADVPARADARFALTLFGGTPATIVRALTALTGRPDVPPAWTFGPWMSSNEWNTQARVLREVGATAEHAIPATVVVIEAWSDETTFYIWNGAEYTAAAGSAAPQLGDFHFPADGPWPDPKGMVDALHAAGIRLLLWQIPALKQIADPHPQHDADTAHAIEQGYVLGTAGGEPYRNSAFWFNGALIPDFTHPDATAWWLAKRRYLLDEVGVDGFKTDGGEHLQGRAIRAHDGRGGDELVNAFPNHYIAAYYRFARERRNGDALTFSRAGYTGAGAFPAHWAGDENSTWEAYRRSIIAGLTAGLSGVPFWGWDIAGFSDALPSAELYLRAAAMATFCPIMQYHSEYTPPGAPSKDRTPWNIAAHTGDDRVVPLYKFFADLRMNLLPYLVSEAAHAAATGEPMLRPLLLDWPEDPVCWTIADQYALGRELLVAPVVEEDATTRRLYLPAGQWFDLWTGAAATGGQWIEVDAPLTRIPVYARAGAVLPLNLDHTGQFGTPVGNAVDSYTSLTLLAFPGASRSGSWVDAHGARHAYRLAAADDGSARLWHAPLAVPYAASLAHGPREVVAAGATMDDVRLKPA